MKYNVLVYKPITKVIRNTWHVEITSTYYDDHIVVYNDQTWNFSNKNEMLDFVNFASIIENAQFFLGYDYKNEIRLRKIIKEDLTEDEYNRNLGLLDQITGHDQIGDIALIDSINVFWFDSDGVKYNCKVVEND